MKIDGRYSIVLKVLPTRNFILNRLIFGNSMDSITLKTNLVKKSSFTEISTQSNLYHLPNKKRNIGFWERLRSKKIWKIQLVKSDNYSKKPFHKSVKPDNKSMKTENYSIKPFHKSFKSDNKSMKTKDYSIQPFHKWMRFKLGWTR